MQSLVVSTIALAAFASFGSAKTVFTGDILSGHPVISSLDITDVPANTISRFWLSPGTGSGGLPYFLPILVARGNEESLKTGRKLSLSASIHGDELNPVAVVQKVFAQLNESVSSGHFNGTVIGLPTVNPQGNLLNKREFFSSASTGYYTDLNGEFPGRNISGGGSLAQSYTDAIWNNVWGNTSNVDVAVDFHASGTGSNGPLWAYADYSLEGTQRIAELVQPDMIKIDPGSPGCIETTFVENGIPAITLEIGSSKNWNQTLIRRTVDFVLRLLDDLQITSGEQYQPDLSNTFVATNVSNDPRVMNSGWVELDVDILEDVDEGQVIGRVYNSWGDKIEDLTSQVTGRVVNLLVDPAVEMGASVATILYNATSSS